MFDEKAISAGELFSFLNIILHKFVSVRMENLLSRISDPVIEPISASAEENWKPSCSFRFKPVTAVWTNRLLLDTDWSIGGPETTSFSFSPGYIKLAEMGWSLIFPSIQTLGGGVSVKFSRRDSGRPIQFRRWYYKKYLLFLQIY